MKFSPEKIYMEFDGKLVGSNKMKIFVCRTLCKFPDKIINQITENCWFFGSLNDAWAYTLDTNELINTHIIIISENLLRQKASQIEYTIAHEIGHVILKHRNSILKYQKINEILQQEKEADEFAVKYLE